MNVHICTYTNETIWGQFKGKQQESIKYIYEIVNK